MSSTVQPTDSRRRFVIPDKELGNVQTVGEAVVQLDLPKDLGLVMLVNERIANWNTPLVDDDILQLIPVPGGG